MSYKLIKKWEYSNVSDDGYHTPLGTNKYHYIYLVNGEKRYYKLEINNNGFDSWTDEGIQRYYPLKQNERWIETIIEDIDYDSVDYKIINEIRADFRRLLNDE